MSGCVFCEILAEDQPVSIVHQDDTCTAFMDIQPVNTGHVLVVPNRHAASLSELDEETGAHTFRVAQRIAAALRRSTIRCEGMNLFLADGRAAGQDVFHVHLHVIPRYAGDGFGLRYRPDYPRRPGRSALEAAAVKIREALA
jgi:histidine triad (HIT) family protein